MLKKTGLLLKFSGTLVPFLIVSLVLWLGLWVMRLHPRVLEPMSIMTGHAEN